jgi:hypothetical protein
MGDNNMCYGNRRRAGVLLAVALLLAIGTGSANAFRVSKNVEPLQDGNFIIKVRLTAASEMIHSLKLIDADESILNVYAPKGWCMVTDGGTIVARSNTNPASKGTVEFIIISNLEDISFTCSAFGRMDQIGKPVTI